MNEYINSNGYVKMNMNMNMDMDMENDAIAVSLGVGSKKPDLCVVLCCVLCFGQTDLCCLPLCYAISALNSCKTVTALSLSHLSIFVILFFCFSVICSKLSFSLYCKALLNQCL